MKILALGGSGGMGRFAVNSLVNHEKIKKIYVADLNASSAINFASNFNDRVEGLELDITNNESLINEMSKVDIVVNTTGPFFKFGLPILKAAIETNTHYFDICDDWEPTEKMLLMNNDEKSSEITGIIGLGASPGLTNILAYLAILELDEVSKVYTGWNISGAKPEDKSSQKGVNAAMVHGIEQVTGHVKVFNNGKFEMVRPLKEVIINYPEIVGRMWDTVIEPKNKNGSPRKKKFWTFRQWITWCYPNNWPPSKTKFTRASRAIIWMTKGKPEANVKQIVQPYRNPWDRRVKGLMSEGKKGPALYDWWPQIDLCKNVSTDKVTDPPYSNQMPEVLLRRIIHITTKPGDVVADPQKTFW